MKCAPSSLGLPCRRAVAVAIFRAHIHCSDWKYMTILHVLVVVSEEKQGHHLKVLVKLPTTSPNSHTRHRSAVDNGPLPPTRHARNGNGENTATHARLVRVDALDISLGARETAVEEIGKGGRGVAEDGYFRILPLDGGPSSGQRVVFVQHHVFVCEEDVAVFVAGAAVDVQQGWQAEVLGEGDEGVAGVVFVDEHTQFGGQRGEGRRMRHGNGYSNARIKRDVA